MQKTLEWLRLTASVSALWLFAIGCDEDGSAIQLSDDPHGEFAEGRVAVIGTDAAGNPVVGSAKVGADGECIEVGDACLPVDAAGCDLDEGPLDLIVVGAETETAICYGDVGAPTQEVQSSGDIEVLQNANGAVVTFDSATDGEPIVGNVDIDGNNVTLYGNGPDATIIQGNVVVDGNNARLRGITVTGNVVLMKNNLSLVLSRVVGNLVIQGNNAVVAGCQVFGNAETVSNNHLLVENGVVGSWAIGGANQRCSGNFKIDDKNADQKLDEGERGAALTCL